jgi:predicted lipoprotein
VVRLALALLAFAEPAAAQTVDHAAIAERALDGYILPGFERLSAATHALAGAAETACAGAGPIDEGPVVAAYNDAFDAWIGVEHLRFGPMQEDNAGFAIAFWPDTKGSTPRTLETMARDADPVVDDPAAFAGVSVAARGLFALDYLMADPEAAPIEAGSYRCRLLVAIARDMAGTADGMLARWRDPWAGILTSAGAADNPVYLAPDEATRALYSALTDQLQADVDLRLGRPLGTFERPQPRRTEAWRSGRSLANMAASLASLRTYAEVVFGPAIGPDHAGAVDRSFAAALAALDRVQGEAFDVAVASAQGRVHVEALQSAVRRVQTEVAEHVGPEVGVTSGFNSMDGD